MRKGPINQTTADGQGALMVSGRVGHSNMGDTGAFQRRSRIRVDVRTLTSLLVTLFDPVFVAEGLISSRDCILLLDMGC